MFGWTAYIKSCALTKRNQVNCSNFSKHPAVVTSRPVEVAAEDRYLANIDADRPNLRQVHLIQAELFCQAYA